MFKELTGKKLSKVYGTRKVVDEVRKELDSTGIKDETPPSSDNIPQSPNTNIMNDNNEEIRSIKHSQGYELETPCFVFGDKVVWGASAMILAELKVIIKKVNEHKELDK